MKPVPSIAAATLLVLAAAAQSTGPTTFGAPCGGQSPGAALALSGTLRPGASVTVQATLLPPASVASLVYGLSRTRWGALSLPQSLAAVGMPGCQLLAAADGAMPFTTGSGSVNLPLQVVQSSALVGQELCLQAFFVQPGLNAAGLGASSGLAGRIAPPPAATSLRSSISQFGITFTFAQPVQAGQFANGDWFVIGPATLVGMQPACTTVGGRTLHGAMINPNPVTRDHGYDSGLFAPNASTYVASLNVALGLSATSPRVLQPNQSLIKVISNTDPNLLPQIRTCSVLTCLAQVPPEGSFRPPYAGSDHQVRYDTSMLDWSALASLAPASGQPHIPTMAALFERPWLDHVPGWVSRYLHPIENMKDYGRDFTADYAEAALLCNLNLPQADRRTLLIRLVQIGIDFWGNVRGGCKWEGCGGHGSGRKLPVLFAGALLHDAGMLAVGQNYRSYRNANGTWAGFFGEDCQTFFVAETSPGVINFGHGGYTAAQVGMPEWGFSHVDWPNNDRQGWTQDSYRLCCTANAFLGQVLTARIMGLVDEWNHPALFAYMDRYVTIQTSGWTFAWLPWTGNMWRMHRASY